MNKGTRRGEGGGTPRAYSFTSQQEQRNEKLFSNLPVLQLIQTIRSDHTLYPRYQNSTKLVEVVNSFARTDCQLPEGWEKRVDPKTNKVAAM